MKPDYNQANSVRYFFFAFAAAFLGFSLLFLGFTSMTFRGPAVISADTPEEEPYRPEPGDAMTVLVMGTAKQGDLPGLYVLLKFNPAAGEIPITVFLPETAVENNGITETLSEVYRYGGAAYTRDVFGEELGISIDRFVRIDQSGFISAADAVGSVEYRLDKEMPLEFDGASVLLRTGMQLLDGKKAAAILAHGGEGRMETAGDLIQSIINQRIDIFLTVASDRIFEIIINLVNSDISYTDYHSRKEAGAFLAGSGIEPAFILPAAGAWNDNRTILTLADTFKAQLARIYG